VRGTTRSAELTAFVHHLLRRIPDKIFLFWDGLNTLGLDEGIRRTADFWRKKLAGSEL
jgi:hypothetical protein